jgi:hypothetical protein
LFSDLANELLMGLAEIHINPARYSLSRPEKRDPSDQIQSARQLPYC